MRIIAVSTDEVFLSNLRRFLDENGGTLCDVQTQGECLERLCHSELDCAIVDLNSLEPGIEVAQVVSDIHGQAPAIPVIIVFDSADIRTAVEVMRKGAVDFVCKSDLLDELPLSLRRCLRTEAQLVDSIQGRFPILSHRELEVLVLLVDGMGNKQIARAMGISRRTVEKHRDKVMKKTRATSLANLIRLALGVS